MPFYCYILKCGDGSFYTGWSTHPSRRLKTHTRGKGARYTRMHPPLSLVYWEEVNSVSAALKRERQIKAYSHQQKRALADSFLPELKTALPNAKWLVRAPGRINVLGEHLDYNGGPVLPAAIDRSLWLAAKPSPDEQHHWTALDLQQTVTCNHKSILHRQDSSGNPLPDWALYPAGVVFQALKKKKTVLPITAAFNSTIPIGAGMSSSAALEVAFALLFQKTAKWKIAPMQLAELCRLAEAKYVGVDCGIMDQFACLFGVKDSILFLNTSDLSWKTVPIPANLSFVVVDSILRHSLKESGYNQRRAECEEALQLLQNILTPPPAILADVSTQQFAQHKMALRQPLRKRVRHVVEETARVHQAVQDMEEGKGKSLGKRLVQGHNSLRDLYQVSLPEIDTLVEIARQTPGCLGARIMGGGFGGGTLNLVQTDQAESFSQTVVETYHKQTGLQAAALVCQASQGAEFFALEE